MFKPLQICVLGKLATKKRTILQIGMVLFFYTFTRYFLLTIKAIVKLLDCN